MTYADAQARIFARGTVPNGYFGGRASVGFALMGKTVVTVAASGWFRSGLPDVVDTREALWMLRHHPNARGITITSEHAA
jgi:hypothetical protein